MKKQINTLPGSIDPDGKSVSLTPAYQSRRDFIQKTALVAGATSIAPGLLSFSSTNQQMTMKKDDISLAQWALVDEIREGKWKTLDFPRIAREEFDINGIEFVNTLFEVPHVNYLNQLKQNAKDQGVEMVLVMVDAEGDGAEPTAELRKQFAVNHRKWIDIANYLGCQAIRTNCRAPKDADPDEALKWAVESYQMLLEYARPADIKLSIENHGGVSNDPDWMVKLIKTVNDPDFGTYPDWRGPSDDFDNLTYLKKTIPYAFGQSYRNQPTEEETAVMIRISQEAGYQGWYGIESSGRDAIHEGVRILNKYLLNEL
jgi:sugar phosphate isomerase/epimerase